MLMKKRVVLLLAVGLLGILVVALVTGCGTTTTTTAKPTTTTAKPAGDVVKIDETRMDATVRVAQNATVELTLKGNATTGFMWDALTFDPKVLESTTKEPEFKADSSAVGAGGTYTWKFKAIGLGGTDLKLDYVGPDKKVDHSFTCQVMVEPGA
jgi:inhibitor of cysteine peptidase